MVPSTSSHGASADALLEILRYHPVAVMGNSFSKGEGNRDAHAIAKGKRRAPLAFVAAAPATRIAAELLEHERLIFYQSISPDAQELNQKGKQRAQKGGGDGSSIDDAVVHPDESLPLELSTSTTPLSRLTQLVCASREAADSSGEDAVWREAGHRSRTRSVLPAACGTHIGDVITVLVSSVALTSHEHANMLAERQKLQKINDYVIEHYVPMPPLGEWLAENRSAKHALTSTNHVPLEMPNDDFFFLFTPATIAMDVLSLPETSIFQPPLDHTRASEAARGAAILHEDRHRQKTKTASAVYTAAQFYQAQKKNHALNSKRLSGSLGASTPPHAAVCYRQVFVCGDSGVEEGLLERSRWWLQRPVLVRDLPSPLRHAVLNDGRYTIPARQNGDGDGAAEQIPLHVKFLVDPFCVSFAEKRWRSFLSQCYRVGLVGSRLFQVPWKESFLQWTQRPRRDAKEAGPMSPGFLFLFAISALLVLLCLPLQMAASILLSFLPKRGSKAAAAVSKGVEAAAGAAPLEDVKEDALSEADALEEWLQGSLRPQCHTMAQLGHHYGTLLETLDLSHTCVTGTHLLSFAVAYHDEQGVATPPRRAAVQLRALDVAGCSALHEHVMPIFYESTLRAWLASTSPHLKREGRAGAKASHLDHRAFILLDRVGSHAGRALALLSIDLRQEAGKGNRQLQLLDASGSSIDDRATAELGLCTLFCAAAAFSSRAQNIYPADTAARPPSPAKVSSLLAVDLSICSSVTSLNALAFLPSLLQVLAAYTYVSDEGIADLHGTQGQAMVVEELVRRLHHIAQHYPEEEGALQLGQAMMQSFNPSSQNRAVTTPVRGKMPEREVPDDDDDSGAGRSRRYSAIGTEPAADDEHSLHYFNALFCSHFYHLDFTFCTSVTDINVLCHQRTLQYLNVSQSFVTSAGVSTIDRPLSIQSRKSVPLRVFIAQQCDFLSDVTGLGRLFNLRKLYIRSPSLADEGLEPFVEHNCACASELLHKRSALQLIDLSYCDKLLDVSYLAKLSGLTVLVLDSTEIAQEGVVGLKRCPCLKTLSVRFCPDFAFIGEDKHVFDTKVTRIPTLKNYIYEDLAGDEELRLPAKKKK